MNVNDYIYIYCSGASLIDLIQNLGVENSINTFLFVLLQRNIMFHSLRKHILTGVVEAITCVSQSLYLYFLIFYDLVKDEIFFYLDYISVCLALFLYTYVSAHIFSSNWSSWVVHNR